LLPNNMAVWNSASFRASVDDDICSINRTSSQPRRGRFYCARRPINACGYVTLLKLHSNVLPALQQPTSITRPSARSDSVSCSNGSSIK
jgi:hypothetical protein